ncbi:MAG: lipopolysaccharide heptosyltransferase II [Nitrospirota bacterium]|nr:lipopolysaccharide heptosyltransferase II [Nitrospirota bacterium]
MVKDRKQTEKGSAILIRSVNWIGDAVMTIPALRALKRSLPEARISLLVKPWVAPLFEKDPDIDEIILYSDEYKGLSGKIRLSRRLKDYVFDSALLFQNAFDAALIAFLAGIKRRIGYNRDGRGFLLTDSVLCDAAAKDLHHIDYYLNLVKKAGFDGAPAQPWLFLDIEERTMARQKLAALKRPVIALNPGAAYGSSKRWLPERFAEVANKVITELNGSVVLLGGPKEAGIADDILNNLESSLVTPVSLLNLAGRTSLRELMAVIAESDVLVTNDSGPMHIGYAVGTPLVAIFGSTSPEHTGPVNKTDIVIRKSSACSPCFERQCKKNNLACMDLITSEEVYSSVKKLVFRKRAVFFDRDGTLCRDAHYLSRMEDFEIFPEISALAELKNHAFSLIGVSNQSGIARGIVPEYITKQVNQIFMDQYGLDAFYYCPHLPDDHCSCRKPEPGMLIRARNDHGIDLKRSFVVGDKEDDMILARAVGAKAILVKTGKAETSPHADAVVNGLDEAVKTILSMSIREGNA